LIAILPLPHPTSKILEPSFTPCTLRTLATCFASSSLLPHKAFNILRKRWDFLMKNSSTQEMAI